MAAGTSKSTVTDEEFEAVLNREPGNLTGFDCAKCLNRGFMWRIKDGCRVAVDCECMTTRRNLQRLKKSGLAPLMEEYTFDRFETPELWQREIKENVLRFVRDKGRRWLLLSGQPGCGKSHLCTAAAGKFLHAGVETRYMRWVDDATAIKAVATDDVAYDRKVSPLKRCRVLYIDDFLKTQKGKEPTSADVKLAFEILNYRYSDPKLITIISTERSMNELMEIDEAVGSRIYERTKGYRNEIAPDRAKNWRMI